MATGKYTADYDRFNIAGVVFTGAQLEEVFRVPVSAVVKRTRIFGWDVLRAVSVPTEACNFYIGKRYGNRTVTRYSGDGKYHWVCDCGREGDADTGTIKKATHCRGCTPHGGSSGVVAAYRQGERYGTKVVVENLGAGIYAWKCDCGVTGKSTLACLKKPCKECKIRENVSRLIGERYGSRVIVGGSSVTSCEWRCDCGASGVAPYGNIKASTGCGECKDFRATGHTYKEDGRYGSSHVGERYGGRIIVSVDLHTDNRANHEWECSCGETGWATYENIRGARSCNKCHKLVVARDRVGQRHGSRVIVGAEVREMPSGRRVYYLWKCDCGAEGGCVYSKFKMYSKRCNACRTPGG